MNAKALGFYWFLSVVCVTLALAGLTAAAVAALIVFGVYFVYSMS